VDLGKLLLSLAPVKGGHGPTLPELLAPRIDSLPRIALRAIGALALVAVVVIVLVAVRLQNPVFSRGGPRELRFNTNYSRALTREPAPAGTLLLLEQHTSIGLEASFAVTVLHLPPYGGEISGLLPVVASGMIEQLERGDPSFIPWSRGRTRINLVPGYTFTYQQTIDGRPYWGRDVLLTRDLSGDREGLLITMLSDPTPLIPIATKPVTPDSVGSVGVLFDPLERLRFG